MCKLWARKVFYVICTGDYNTGFLDWCPLTSATITLLPNTLQYRFYILHGELKKSKRILWNVKNLTQPQPQLSSSCQKRHTVSVGLHLFDKKRLLALFHWMKWKYVEKNYVVSSRRRSSPTFWRCQWRCSVLINRLWIEGER